MIDWNKVKPGDVLLLRRDLESIPRPPLGINYDMIELALAKTKFIVESIGEDSEWGYSRKFFRIYTNDKRYSWTSPMFDTHIPKYEDPRPKPEKKEKVYYIDEQTMQYTSGYGWETISITKLLFSLSESSIKGYLNQANRHEAVAFLQTGARTTKSWKRILRQELKRRQELNKTKT